MGGSDSSSSVPTSEAEGNLCGLVDELHEAADILLCGGLSQDEAVGEESRMLTGFDGKSTESFPSVTNSSAVFPTMQLQLGVLDGSICENLFCKYYSIYLQVFVGVLQRRLFSFSKATSPFSSDLVLEV